MRLLTIMLVASIFCLYLTQSPKPIIYHNPISLKVVKLQAQTLQFTKFTYLCSANGKRTKDK